MTTLITSLQNPLIKSIVKLQQKASERKSSGMFVAEGRREVSIALRHDFEAEKLIWCREFYKPDPVYPIPVETFPAQKLAEVSAAVYNKMAYRENTEGILLLGKSRQQSLDDFNPNTNSLVIMLEGVEKPGNLGAILRTTDAAAAEAVLLCNARTDLYNPNAIRASLGCVFSQKVIICTSQEALNWCKKNSIRVFAAAPQTQHFYFDADFRKASAIAFGSEDHGLSSIWFEKAEQVIKIPMKGIIDSLNVSTSVAIVTFEAVRQRTTL